MKLLIINGPNLNLLGERQPEIYGNSDFQTFFDKLKAKYQNIAFEYFVSNHEGEIIDKIHESRHKVEGIIINAGAYTHTSLALADAVTSIKIPVVEVHISNIAARDKIRRKSLLAPFCKGSINGFGLDSYRLAVESFLSY